jgi:catechol 2,3-dioxygenase-like lactoylglutathione lyase family enzyme
MQFQTETNIAIHVLDLVKAKDFYTRVMGFRLLEETGERLVLATGSLTLFVAKDEVTMPFIPALGVNDLDKARRYLKEHNARIVREFAPTRSFYFEDPFGIVWDVNEP